MLKFQKIIEKVKLFSEFDLDWWIKDLMPILQNISSAVGGHSYDKNFWKSFYKFQHESGGASVSGWINTLFPYVGKKLTVTI